MSGEAMGKAGQRESTTAARPAAGGGWGRPVLKALLMLGASVAVLVVVPDRLIAFLAPRVTPTVRDLVIVAWVTVSFIGLCWVFIVLQRSRR